MSSDELNLPSEVNNENLIQKQNDSLEKNIYDFKKQSNLDERKFMYSQINIINMKSINFYLMVFYLLLMAIFMYFLFFYKSTLTQYITIYLKIFIYIVMLLLPFILDIIQQLLIFLYKYIAVLLKFKKFSNPIIRQ